MSLTEAKELRKMKAEELGLVSYSSLPKFSHQMSIQELRNYPQFDKWHMYRRAMENKLLEQHELPLHFQSNGKFLFHNVKGRTIARQTEQDKEKRKTRSAKEIVRYHKLRELRLHRNSGLPVFAQKLGLEELKDDKNMAEWHEHREKVEQGTLKQELLPEQYRSKIPGRLVFKDRDATRTSAEQDKQTKSEKHEQHKVQRFERLKQLRLPSTSPTPIFAQKLNAEELKNHEEMNEWHRHRELLEKKAITEKDLPEHFKPSRGTLVLHKRPLTSTQWPDLSLNAQQAQRSKRPASTEGEPYVHQSFDLPALNKSACFL